MREQRNIIYGLTDPRDGALRYIGQSCRGIGRAHQHRTAANQKWNSHKKNWVRKLQSLGLSYAVVVIERLDGPDRLNEREAWWIAFARAWGCRLVNATDGGDGVRGLRFSKESIAKMSAAQIGRRHSEETKAKIAAAHRGKIVSEETRERLRNRPLNPAAMAAFTEFRNSKENADRLRGLAEFQRGKHPSEEIRAKMSAAQHSRIRKPHSPGARANMSAAAMGRVISEATRAKMSAANKGRKLTRPRSAEWREKQRVSKIGKSISLETRAKISEALKGRIKSEQTRAKLRVASTGRRHSAETRAKISTAKQGRKETQPRSAEWRTKVSAANKGKKRSRETVDRIKSAWILRRNKPISDETRARLSAAATGRTHAPETRTRMSELKRQWWARRNAIRDVISAQQGPM